MPVFSNQEKIDIIAVFREVDNSPRRARRLYAQRFPGRLLPSLGVFARTEMNLRLHGAFGIPMIGNRRIVDDPHLRALVVEHVNDNPHIGQRGIALALGTSRHSVGRILKSEFFHNFKVHLNQELRDGDFQRRVDFCNFMLQQLQLQPNFQHEICWSDESTFSSEGTVNRHNMHYYSIDNPHWMQDRHIQGGYIVPYIVH
ncbi:uncharacterized protein LOC117647911 [Thrips palmi]|uniref:Uncharacterized protein LOC117647911 n=1 Tax=Thrips palmi TaxID=161013 RepID=A0A6P8ZC08_THRPL|nr:uncharacterized protein LOC117647911 [Thrips palmi]